MLMVRRNRWSRVIRGTPACAAVISIVLAVFANEVTAEPGSPNAANAEAASVGENALWDSPTSGKPLDLKYLPQGIEAVIAIRPASLLKHPEAQKLFDPQGRVLGPAGELLVRDLPAWIGAKAQSIDQLLLAIVEGSDRPFEVGLVIRFVDSPSEQDLVAAWGKPRSTEFIDNAGTVHRIYKGLRHGFYLPPSEKGKVLVIIPPLSPADLTAHLGMLFSGTAPTAPTELDKLLRSSDSDRHLTIAFRPSFLLAQENGVFSGVASRLREPLREFLSFQNTPPMAPLTEAALLSCHLGDSFFTELRLGEVSAPDKTGIAHRQEIAEQLQSRVRSLPRQIKAYIFGLYLSPYARDPLIDFDTMLQKFAGFTRVAAVGEQVVARTYLPAGAAQHLALCTYLSLQENYVKEAPLVIVQSRTAQKLQKKTSLIIERDSYEKALERLGEKLGVTIEILKNDLQLDGITKGQSLGIHEINKTGKEILESILTKAHPNFVYFIRSRAEAGRDVVYISTRDGVFRRKMTPPPPNELDATPLEADEVPSLEEKLEKKISMEFNRNPLEVTMQLLSEALDVEIQVLGLDLQLDGITKNQSSGMNEQNKSGKQILLGFLSRAHPKLVYFSKPKVGSPGDEVLYISSQSGVRKRLEAKETIHLPPEFRSLLPANQR